MSNKKKSSTTPKVIERLWCCCMGYNYEEQTVKVNVSIPIEGTMDEYGEPQENTQLIALPFQLFPRLPKFGQSFLLTIRHDTPGDKGYPHIIYRKRKSAKLDALRAEIDKLLDEF
jgi:hypothetical protein